MEWALRSADGISQGGHDIVLASALPGHTPSVIRGALSSAAGKPVVLCLPTADARAARKAIDGGADGVVLVESLSERLAVTLSAVAAGQICVPRETRRRLHRPELTTREKQVLALVVMGLSNGEIAGRLFVSEATVKSHLSSVFRKLGATSRADAARIIADPSEGLGTGVLSIT